MHESYKGWNNANERETLVLMMMHESNNIEKWQVH